MRYVAFVFLFSRFVLAAGGPQLVGDGTSAYFTPTDLRQAQELRGEMPLPGFQIPDFNKALNDAKYNTLVVFQSKGFLATDKTPFDLVKADLLIKNSNIAAMSASALDEKSHLISEKGIRNVFSAYYAKKTHKDLKDVPNQELRNTIKALLSDDYRLFQQQISQLPYHIRKAAGQLTKAEIEAEAKQPSISARAPEKTIWDQKREYQEKMRADGTSEAYIWFDSFMNPAWKGTGNFDDVISILSGFGAVPGAIEPLPGTPGSMGMGTHR